MTTCCQKLETAAIESPFCSVLMKRTPTAVPVTPPTPPRKLVPPSSTAAAASSGCSPTRGLAAPRRLQLDHALDACAEPGDGVDEDGVNATLIPESRAALTLLPTAHTSRPKYVQRRTTRATRYVPIMIQIG